MDQQKPEATGGASVEPRVEWTAPEVERFIAGGAEGSAGSDVEGLDGLS